MGTLMKAVVKTGEKHGYEIKYLDIPRPKQGEILVRIKVVGICGTDLHIVEWNQWAASRVKLPLIFGHEFSGEIVELGPAVEGLSLGDLVTGETHITCGSCFYCKTCQSHLCENGQVIGLDVNGAFAEYICFPAKNAWKLEGFSLETGSIINPLGNAVYAVLSTAVTGSSVVIIGCGPVGLYSIITAMNSGASAVYAVDINNYRLDLARKMGVNRCINPTNEDVCEIVKQETNGIGADIVLEISGSSSGISSAFSMVRRGGSIRLIGIPERNVSLNLSERIIFPEINLQGISGRDLYRTYYQIFGLLNSGMDVDPVVTHRLSFANFAEGIALMSHGDCGKILLSM